MQKLLTSANTSFINFKCFNYVVSAGFKVIYFLFVRLFLQQVYLNTSCTDAGVSVFSQPCFADSYHLNHFEEFNWWECLEFKRLARSTSYTMDFIWDEFRRFFVQLVSIFYSQVVLTFPFASRVDLMIWNMLRLERYCIKIVLRVWYRLSRAL